VERIVIVTSQPEPDRTLLALVSAAFPECEIHIVFRGVETFEQSLADSSSGLPMTDTIGGK
jgi:hypothetical protein